MSGRSSRPRPRPRSSPPCPAPGTEDRTFTSPGWRSATSWIVSSSPRAVQVRSSMRIRRVSNRSSASRMKVNSASTDGSSPRRAATSGCGRSPAETGRAAARSQGRVAVIRAIVAASAPPPGGGPQPPPGPPPSPGSVILAGSSSSSSRSGAMPRSRASSRIVRPVLKRLLGHLRRLVVADDRRQRGGQHQALLDERRPALGRLEPLDAACRKLRAAAAEQHDRLEQRRRRSPAASR